MKVVKKTSEYTVLQRRDGRYAVQDSKKSPINGDEKIKILVAEDLLKVALPAEPEPEVEATEEAADEAPAEEAAAEEAPAEEAAAEEAPAEEAAGEEEKPE